MSVPWPGGARCAACISWDVDADTLVLHRLPERGHELHGGLSWLRYDEVAVPAIVQVFERYGIKQTFFVCAWCIERYPAMCESILAGGHEIGYHGYLHEAPNEQPPERELEELERGMEIIERFTGRRPSGARAPYAALSASSADFLVRAGFSYDSSLMSDSEPFVLEAGGGRLIELPIDTTMSDWPHFAHVPDLGYLMPPKSPAGAIEVFRSEFDAAYELGGLWITIWHPHVSGRPARRLAWTALLESLLERGDVWFATLDEIARHVRSCIEAGTYDPRVVPLPFYDEPVPEFADLARPGARRPAKGGAP
jgi:peptidoglycan/xylan/chitin deacetylase (PgdA/CDA1 family)